MPEIKLIVGLGNPGKAYQNSRHNLGARVVAGLAREFRLKFKKSWLFHSLVAEAKTGKDTLIFLLPLTFMNNSGKAVKKIISRKKIKLENLLVVTDDINLPFGDLRVKSLGSDGGHNGLSSVISSLAAKNFSRLRLGIGVDAGKEDLKDFVLANFSNEEEKALKPFIKKAQSCISFWLEEGIAKAMNKFN